MSRQHDEERTPGKRKKASKAATQGRTDFYTFHPTEAEKKAIKAMELEGDGLLEAAASMTENGLQLTLTMNRAGSALCLLIKQQGMAFGEGTTLAFFHSNVTVLFTQAVYFLNTVAPNWPAEPVGYSQAEFDW